MTQRVGVRAFLDKRSGVNQPSERTVIAEQTVCVNWGYRASERNAYREDKG
jgi:hypothetical protein